MKSNTKGSALLVTVIIGSDDVDNDSKMSILSELNYRAFNTGYKFSKTNSEMIDESYTNKFY
ncbi:MAG: hypothetical protein LC127_14270 [Chitinophagales bacterium]|nr:hypothetical protein [Chitinophagales bacterium]